MMIFNQQIDSLEIGYWLANALRFLRTGTNRQDIDSLFARETELSVNSYSNQDAFYYPPFYWASSGSYTLILIGPTQNLDQATRLLLGYTVGSLTAPEAENEAARGARVRIITDAMSNHASVRRNVYIAGYSFGGMIAQEIYKFIVDMYPDARPNVITFGAPRVFGQTIARTFTGANVVRWMNDNDPIPLIPARLANGPSWAMTVDPQTLLQWGVFVHTAGGISLNEQGQGREAINPQAAVLAPTLSLAAFLMGQVTGEGGGHSLDEYLRRMNVPLGGDFEGSHEVPPSRLMEPLAAQDRRGINATSAATVSRVFRQGQEQAQVAVIIPDPQRPKVIRQGRIWSVYWGGTFVAMGPTKKRALRLKNMLLQFLRSMQHQAVTEPDALVRRFQEYFDLAVQANQGFEPVLQDEFPED